MATKRDWEDLFRRADVDRNGNVTVAELAKSMHIFGYPGTEAKMKILISQNDRDYNKMLSMEEFVACMKKAPIEVHVAALLNTVFSRYDQDQDGVITLDELNAAFRSRGKKLSADTVRSIFSAADLDGSGTLNLKEFQIAVSKKIM